MKGIAVVAVLTILALAPSAVAKGPHASVSSGPAGIEPGEPWVTKLTFVKFGARDVVAARPTVILRSGSQRFAVYPTPLGSHVAKQPDVLAEARYRLRVVFPRAGRWSVTVLDGTRADRRFRFPAAAIGGGAERVSTDLAAFPQGSPAEAPTELGDALAPERVLPQDDVPDGGRSGLWIPAAGLTLAGVGALTVLRRRRR